ncbi:MAG: hypothetical protein LQ347_000947 [Umbilicaria vellea]|nr:MAG: hypothetical protein LQ347_000947 [Umbilicaria vellea]
MSIGFLDLPAEIRILIYELIFTRTEPVEVRPYLNRRRIRSVTSAGKKDGNEKSGTDGKATGAPAFMATCRQVYSETCAVACPSMTFLCERISDFLEFTRSLGSRRTRLIETVQIASHNCYMLPGLQALTGLKTLVVAVKYQLRSPQVWTGASTQAKNLHWTRRTQVLEAVTKFAAVQGCLVRFEVTVPGTLHCSRSFAADEVEAAGVEIDEYTRGLRTDKGWIKYACE